jgi:hypothetical protein
MPNISDAQLAKLGNQITSRDAMIERLRSQVKSKQTQDNATSLGLAAAGSAAFCFARGKLEDKASGAWNIPGTQIDWEAAAVLAVTTVALGGGMISPSLKKLENPATAVACGLIGHYAGQLARKVGRTGEFSMVAGMLPSPGDGSRSLSYHRTQIASPYADPVAQALSQSGV